MKTIKQPEYAIRVDGVIRSVTEDFFRSWSGERYVDGKPYVGPIYFLFSEDHVDDKQVCESWDSSRNVWIKMPYWTHKKLNNIK